MNSNFVESKYFCKFRASICSFWSDCYLQVHAVNSYKVKKRELYTLTTTLSFNF